MTLDVIMLEDTDDNASRRMSAICHALVNDDWLGLKPLVVEPMDPSQWKEVLQMSAFYGSPTCLEHLLKRSPSPVSPDALLTASAHGQSECVRLLIPVTDCKADASNALRTAAQSNHTKSVSLLLPVSDVFANNFEALFMAIYHHNHEMIEEICQHVRPSLLQFLEPNMVSYFGASHQETWDYFSALRTKLIQSEQLHTLLSTTLSPSSPKSRPLKL